MVERVHAVVDAVREEFAGGQVVLVSHQAPIWVARLAFERRRLAHWPGFRRCTLASVTTLTFDGDQLTGVSYAEPAAPPCWVPPPAPPGCRGPGPRTAYGPSGKRSRGQLLSSIGSGRVPGPAGGGSGIGSFAQADRRSVLTSSSLVWGNDR